MLQVLKVLMWMQFLVRKKRWIRTLLEIFSCFALFLLFFLTKDGLREASKNPKKMEEAEIQFTQTKPYSLDMTMRPERILYTPDSELTRNLMTSVAKKLKLSLLDKLPEGRTRGVVAIEDDATIYEYSKKMRFTDAIVIFENMSGGKMPKKLNYTIRMKEDYRTGAYRPIDPDTGEEAQKPTAQPHFGQIYDTFVSLQWAIDSSFIESFTNEPVRQSVKLQEMPYSNINDPITNIVLAIFVYLAATMSTVMTFINLVSNLADQRSSGIMELMKMSGASPNMIGFSHFLATFFIGFIFYAVLGTVLLQLSMSGYSLVPNVNAGLVLLALTLYYISIIAFAFVCSFFFKSNASITLASMIHLGLTVAGILTIKLTRNKIYQHLLGLVPQIPVFWLFMNSAVNYDIEKSDIMRSYLPFAGSFLSMYTMLAVQSLMWFALAWYLQKVLPGKYGVAQPWNFLCQRDYWRKPTVSPLEAAPLEEGGVNPDPKFFEKAPSNLEVGIKIVNVSKVFKKMGVVVHRALTNVNLNIYRGEICVLLGHNGAGKTTLINIITGMISPSHGDVYVNGLHIQRSASKVRKLIGFCPQHNLFFTELTCLQHVMFFSMLKGQSCKQARISSIQLLEHMGIRDKARMEASQLSGGMKRRLQLSMALAGDGSVLLLDEPTSGLDVHTRRALWDLLLGLRGNRTVLLTTHFLEEADALGDRAAALHAGIVRSHATPMHLKRAVGSGYRLTLITKNSPQEAKITSIVHNHVPDATVKEHSLNTIAYNLPAERTQQLPGLFRELESRKHELEIENIGVGSSTLEDVFMILCSDVDTSFEDEVDGAARERVFPKHTGRDLLCKQFKVLWWRQMKYTWHTKVSFLLANILIPLLIIIGFTYVSNSSSAKKSDNPSAEMSLRMYSDMRPKVLYRVANNLSKPISRVALMNSDAVFRTTGSEGVADQALSLLKKDSNQYSDYLLGVDINDRSAVGLYSTYVRHAAPTAVNLLSNTLASILLDFADGNTITTYNHPLDGVYARSVEPHKVKDITSIKMTLGAVVGAICLACLYGLKLTLAEKESGVRHNHIMYGANPILYWMTTLLYHMTIYTFIILLSTVIIMALVDDSSTYNDASFITVLTLILLVGGLAVFAFQYVISIMFKSNVATIVYVVCVFIFAFMQSGELDRRINKTFGIVPKEKDSIITLVHGLVGPVFPFTHFSLGAMGAAMVGRLNAICRENRANCPTPLVTELGFDSAACCRSTGDMRSYYNFWGLAPLKEILILLGFAFILMLIVLLYEYGFWSRVCERVTQIKHKYKAPARLYNDRLVNEEAANVQEAFKLVKSPSNENALLAYDLHKRYGHFFTSSKDLQYSVKGINFSVKKGECFGLLGVNGAGKSTTFKMLTGELAPTRGHLYAGPYSIRTHRKQYMHSLAYCPQFGGADEFLTGRENLKTVLTLRGYMRDDIKTETEAWIHVVGLEKYAERAVSGYSGGCQRRLACALALGSGSPCVLLDEPTTGVDAGARRRVWAAVRRASRAYRAVTITTHSMDEVEALCDRVCILARGEVAALGSPAQLRANYALGHAISVKLNTNLPNVDYQTETNRLKTAVTERFRATLKDAHTSMLQFHMDETRPYSELFTTMESLKNEFPIIEDYNISETTLEEVFISFAQGGRHDAQTSV